VVSHVSAALDERTVDEVSQAYLRELASRVRALVGLDLTAYLADAHSVQEFVTWLDKVDPAVGAESARRLAATLQLASVFRSAKAITRLKSWLREVDERLGRSPATLIRESADDLAVAGLRPAAQRYLHALA
jgi:hypothetical protein